MQDLEHYENYIIDNKNSIIINLKLSTVLYFDFENMHLREDNKKTLKPIRYDIAKENILYWGNQRWRPFRPPAKAPIMTLFNNYNERTILGVNDDGESTETC